MTMRAHLLSSACVLAISAGAAQAQGLPAPAGGWAGGYVGGLLGAGFSMNRFTDVGAAIGPADTTYSINPVGVALGLYAGYNWQLSPTGVVGIEADLTYNTASGSTPGLWGGTVSAKAQFAGSLRVRAGVAVDRALLYVTAGLALGSAGVCYTATADPRQSCGAGPVPAGAVVAPATDDRPFLYYQGGPIPALYLWTLGGILLISLLAVRIRGGPFRTMRP